MKLSALVWKGATVLIGVVLMSACSGGGSSSTGTTTITTYPFGVEDSVVETDTNEDGYWDVRETTSHTLNGALQVVEITTTTEYDDNGDGLTDRREVVTNSYDPETLSSSTAATTRVVDGLGLLVGVVTESYGYDDVTGQVALYAEEGRDDTYRYDADGNHLSTTRLHWFDDDHDGSVDNHATLEQISSYDASGNILVSTSIEEHDTDADGVSDYEREQRVTYVYDAEGSPLSQSVYYRYDDDGDAGSLEPEIQEAVISYDYVYTDGVITQLMLSLVAEGEEEVAITLQSVYDDEGMLVAQSYQPVSDDESTVVSEFSAQYAYDEAGRMTSCIMEEKIRPADSASWQHVRQYGYLWGYDSDGLLTTETAWTRVESPEGSVPLESYSYSTETFEYENGRPIRICLDEYTDADLDGELDYISLRTESTYSYHLWFLSSRVVTNSYDDDGDGTFDRVVEAERRDYLYEGNLLVEGTITTEDQEEAFYLDYDNQQRLLGYRYTNDEDGDSVVDTDLTLALDYSVAGVVTGVFEKNDGALATGLLEVGLVDNVDLQGTDLFSVGEVDVDYPISQPVWDGPGFDVDTRSYSLIFPNPKVLSLLDDGIVLDGLLPH